MACSVHMAPQEMYYGAKKPPLDLSKDGFGILVAPRARVNPNFLADFDILFHSPLQKAQILPSVLRGLAYLRPTMLAQAVCLP